MLPYQPKYFRPVHDIVIIGIFRTKYEVEMYLCVPMATGEILKVQDGCHFHLDCFLIF